MQVPAAVEHPLKSDHTPSPKAGFGGFSSHPNRSASKLKKWCLRSRGSLSGCVSKGIIKNDLAKPEISSKTYFRLHAVAETVIDCTTVTHTTTTVQQLDIPFRITSYLIQIPVIKAKNSFSQISQVWLDHFC